MKLKGINIATKPTNINLLIALLKLATEQAEQLNMTLENINNFKIEIEGEVS